MADEVVTQITPAQYSNPILQTLVHQYRSGVDKSPSDFKQKLDLAVFVGDITPAEAAEAMRNESEWRAPGEWVDERGEVPVVADDVASGEAQERDNNLHEADFDEVAADSPAVEPATKEVRSPDENVITSRSIDRKK